MVMKDTIITKLKKENNKLNGSFTVEAAIIIPIVTIVIFFLIYLGLYLHDRSKVQAKLHEILSYGTNLIQYGIYPDGNILNEKRDFLYLYLNDKTVEKEVILNMLQDVNDHNLFMAKLEDIKIHVDISELIIQGELVYGPPISGLIPIFTKSRSSIPIKLSGTVFPREEKTRVLDVALTTGKNVKGVKTAIEKLAVIVNEIK